jgi:hypothetical protein
MFGWQASSLLVFWSVLYFVLGRIFQFLVFFGRGDRAKEAEIVALPHQVVVLRRQVNRPDLGDADRVLLAALSRLLPRSSWSSFFVTPACGHPTGTEWRMSSRTQDRLCCGAVAGWREDISNGSATALGQPCHWEMLPALILESSRDWLPAPGALSCS